mmetsp:Transcript_7129/g.17124  ORF Transcript_7129/g.17124 Transcript_7129/m.17124 type:complete len:225 (+) Transcript_7129:1251-1925(+)
MGALDWAHLHQGQAGASLWQREGPPVHVPADGGAQARRHRRRELAARLPHPVAVVLGHLPAGGCDRLPFEPGARLGAAHGAPPAPRVLLAPRLLRPAVCLLLRAGLVPRERHLQGGRADLAHRARPQRRVLVHDVVLEPHAGHRAPAEGAHPRDAARRRARVDGAREPGAPPGVGGRGERAAPSGPDERRRGVAARRGDDAGQVEAFDARPGRGVPLPHHHPRG